MASEAPVEAPVEATEQLRAQLRDRGYLTHGIERWFALDPWSSRAFWIELTIVAAKAAALIALFAALPPVAIMLVRNHPLTAGETLLMTLLYGATAFVVGLAFIVVVALIMKLRPELAIDTPRALLAISFLASAILAVPLALWWSHFDAPPSLPELAIGGALAVIFFVISTIVISAALLSFSVYELQRVPAIHQKPRTLPMTIAAAVLIALLFIPAYAAQEKGAAVAPLQVVTTPTTGKIALIAVDGLTYDIFESRPALANTFTHVTAAQPMPGESATERWASAGTGVPPRIHGVRAIEGLRFAGGPHVIQSLSRDDVVLHTIAPALHAGRREPLPPTVRRRDYIWEIVAARGVPSVAVNWWTTESLRAGALDSIGQESIFAAAHGDAVRVDEEASRRLLVSIRRDSPRFATVYLPALDVVLNRLPLDPSARLAASVRALDGIEATVSALAKAGYEVVVVGLPGDRQHGNAVIASTAAFPTTQVYGVAPSLLHALGFPPSSEMPAATDATRIATYGTRHADSSSMKVDQEYYENLKSLGYIR
ncbi:MAG TPA: alkaline phosphatase family protein [Thermoanaerobaculia bacterium]